MPAAPNSQLERKYQKEIKRQGYKIRVVENASIAVERLLKKSDRFKPRQCEREDCPVCRTDGNGPCNRESVTHEIKCTECNLQRLRRRNIEERVYQRERTNKEERSALEKHCGEKHSSEI